MDLRTVPIGSPLTLHGTGGSTLGWLTEHAADFVRAEISAGPVILSVTLAPDGSLIGAAIRAEYDRGVRVGAPNEAALACPTCGEHGPLPVARVACRKCATPVCDDCDGTGAGDSPTSEWPPIPCAGCDGKGRLTAEDIEHRGPPAISDRTRGLFEKYRVSNADGSVSSDAFFVLRPCDPHAEAAMACDPALVAVLKDRYIIRKVVLRDGQEPVCGEPLPHSVALPIGDLSSVGVVNLRVRRMLRVYAASCSREYRALAEDLLRLCGATPPRVRTAPQFAAGTYLHYDGGIYDATDVAYDSTNGSTEGRWMVVYRSRATSIAHVREIAQFRETIMGQDGVEIPRFERLESNDRA